MKRVLAAIALLGIPASSHAAIYCAEFNPDDPTIPSVVRLDFNAGRTEVTLWEGTYQQVLSNTFSVKTVKKADDHTALTFREVTENHITDFTFRTNGAWERVTYHLGEELRTDKDVGNCFNEEAVTANSSGRVK